MILDELIPALRDVKSFLSRLKGSRSVPTGALIEYTPENSGVDGLEYYKSLVRYYSSSDESLEEILDYLSAESLSIKKSIDKDYTGLYG